MIKSEYLIFKEIQSLRKTKVIGVYSKSSNAVLGTICWYSPWRQYCWMPLPGTVFSYGCNEDINKTIKELMDERKTHIDLNYFIGVD